MSKEKPLRRPYFIQSIPMSFPIGSEDAAAATYTRLHIVPTMDTNNPARPQMSFRRAASAPRKMPAAPTAAAIHPIPANAETTLAIPINKDRIPIVPYTPPSCCISSWFSLSYCILRYLSIQQFAVWYPSCEVMLCIGAYGIFAKTKI